MAGGQHYRQMLTHRAPKATRIFLQTVYRVVRYVNHLLVAMPIDIKFHIDAEGCHVNIESFIDLEMFNCSSV